MKCTFLFLFSNGPSYPAFAYWSTTPTPLEFTSIFCALLSHPIEMFQCLENRLPMSGLGQGQLTPINSYQSIRSI